MADLKLDITDKGIARLPYADTGQYRVRDADVTGFLVLVGKRTKTFIAQGEYWHNGQREFSVRTKVGEFGHISSREAKSKAKEVLGAIARGERPGAPRKERETPVSLRDAWERYRVSHMERKGRSDGTIANYRDHMERLFTDWLDKPLAHLGDKPELVVKRHDGITEVNCPYIANGAMRSLGAIYNHAAKSHRDLPAINPVMAIDWN